MTTARFTTTGISRIAAKYSRAANFLGRSVAKGILNTAAQSLVTAFQEKIQSFTPGSVPDLSPKYKDQKLKKYGRVYPILFGSGSMFESMKIQVRSPSGSQGWVFRLSFDGDDYLGVANADKAEYHTLGKGRNPKRDFTQIPSQWKSEVRDLFSLALRGAKNNG